jgi:hypothetical protein
MLVAENAPGRDQKNSKTSGRQKEQASIRHGAASEGTNGERFPPIFFGEIGLGLEATPESQGVAIGPERRCIGVPVQCLPHQTGSP